MKFTVKIFAFATILLGFSFLAFKVGVESQKTTVKAQKEIYVSECLDKWRDNVEASAKKGNAEIMLWTLGSYAEVLNDHLELANTKDWYAFHKEHIIFELGMAHANIGYCYENMGMKTLAQKEMKKSFEIFSSSQNSNFKNVEDIWSFSKSRLFFKPKKMNWGKAKVESAKETTPKN